MKRSVHIIAAISAMAISFAISHPSSAAEPRLSPEIEVAPQSDVNNDDATLPPRQEATPSLEEQLYFGNEEVVTGPAKRAMKLSEAPANVFIVTHEDIIQSGVTNLAEVFRRVPGMDVVWISNADSEVSMRGFAGPLLDGQRISVMIDGRTYYHEFLSGTVWNEIPVPLSDIKRIEVIKGPMSALYGNKAMLGVINIVTYEPEETRTTLMGGGGQYYLGAGDFANAGKFADGYWYKVTGHYIRQNELSDSLNDGSTKGVDVLAFTGKLMAQPTDATRASLTGVISQSYGLVQFGGLSPWNERRSVVDSRFSHDFGTPGKLSAQAYWERHYISSPNFPAFGTFVVDNVDGELRHSLAFDISADIKNTLTYGAEYRFVNVTSQPYQSINNYAGFLQDEFRLFDKVILTGGMRADYQHDFAGLNISANGSTVFLIDPRYTLRIGFGTAFNAPNYIHYYAQATQPLVPPGSGTIVGNRNLKAERVLYLDVGNTIKPIEEMTVHADFFFYRLNNMLTPQATFTPAGAVASFINDGGADAIGGEIGINGQICQWLEGYANWSYEHFSPINGNLNPAANMGNPENKAGAGLRGSWFGKRLTANIDFFYTHKYQRQTGVIAFPFIPVVNIDSSYLLNARIGYWPIRDHLEIAVAANNILDDNTYQVPPVDPFFNVVLAERPRFNIWGSLRYQF